FGGPSSGTWTRKKGVHGEAAKAAGWLHRPWFDGRGRGVGRSPAAGRAGGRSERLPEWGHSVVCATSSRLCRVTAAVAGGGAAVHGTPGGTDGTLGGRAV